ncbi:glycosyltransferase family 2 protein [Arenimonas sp.]|uniref:glycosyltransferase family 2 protein n=1 Tax=Arenimonas sp. TaxID=1872635 RepID=UPI0039E3318D
MSETPRVSALMPAYNAAAFIQPVLDSLSAQDEPGMEVLISVDDCDDGTFEICEAHALRDRRFRVLRQASRLGWIGNSNFLLGQAIGEYAIFAFHDDRLAPDCISRLAHTLDTHPEAVLAYGDTELTRVDGSREHWQYEALDGVTDPLARARRLLRRNGQWWVAMHGLFRMAQARRIGGLKLHGAGAFSADWPWLLHLSLLGDFVRVPGTLCFKRYHPDSLSRRWAYSREDYFEASVSCLREIWNSRLSSRQKLALALPFMQWLERHRRATICSN